MKVGPSILAGLLPPNTEWVPVTGGESGATVVYDQVGQRYAKIVTSAHVEDLAGERDRVDWLEATGIPCASVLDWRANEAGACLITRAVAGVPASRLDPRVLRRAWPSVVDTVRALHDLPGERCPFDRTLATMMPLASAIVAENRVHVEFLPVTVQRTPPRAILQGLEDELSRRLDQERTEHVVCHGDLCLPNIHVDPARHQVTGLIDLGRLGRADPYADIALLLANARATWPSEKTARRADEVFAQRYGTRLDPERRRFYLLLDPLTW